ncbi:MAG: chorismate synthase [Clostridia bacterium]|nr:chorismate synthase [Clostridia bacterium]
MAIFKGEKLNIEIYGTSHAEKIGVRVSGFPRLKIDEKSLLDLMKRRMPTGGVFSTKRKEPDLPIFVKGVNNGVIDGFFEAVIYNKDVKSQDYGDLYAKPRPSHADYVRYLKDGEKDYRGGGEFSGRLTAPFCIVGGLCKQYLYENYGVEILAYLSSVGKVDGRSYKQVIPQKEDIKKCHESGFPALSSADEMIEEIVLANQNADSVGGTVECVIYGAPTAIGGSLFEGLEGKIALAVYSIPAVKGVEFGDGFDLARGLGSAVNDGLQMDGDKVKIVTNHAGGLNGGITNGNPVTLRVGFRPTPSIGLPQDTVDLEKMENVKIVIKGRHDACVAVRAVPVVESAVAIALLDAIMQEKK